MKNILVALLIIVIIAMGIYLYLNRTPVFVPSVSIITPKGGEDFKLGERFRYVIEVSHQNPGTLEVFLTTSNDLQNWRNGTYYELGKVRNTDFDKNNMARGSFVLEEGKNITPRDKYYLLGIWNSNDQIEQAQGISSYEFKISR